MTDYDKPMTAIRDALNDIDMIRQGLALGTRNNSLGVSTNIQLSLAQSYLEVAKTHLRAAFYFGEVRDAK